ncbi:FeoB-associated Cys-rich membrane protein [Anaerovibrio sp.]
MATYVIGLILLILLGFAGRHVWNNFRSGKHDCCGSDCGCGCGSNCISRK